MSLCGSKLLVLMSQFVVDLTRRNEVFTGDGRILEWRQAMVDC